MIKSPTPAELLKRYEAVRRMISTIPNGGNVAEKRIAERFRELLTEEQASLLMQLILSDDPRQCAVRIATDALAKAQASVRAARKAKRAKK